jgi:hypothetical protein
MLQQPPKQQSAPIRAVFIFCEMDKEASRCMPLVISKKQEAIPTGKNFTPSREKAI